MGSIKNVGYYTNSYFSDDKLEKIVPVQESAKTKNLLETPVQKPYVEVEKEQEETLTINERESIVNNFSERKEVPSSLELYELMKPQAEVIKDRVIKK